MNIGTSLGTARRPAAPLALVRASGQGEAPTATSLRLAPGQVLLHAGQRGTSWRIESGALRIERCGGGAGTLIQLALPGDCVGWEALLDQPCAATVSALVASTVCIKPVGDDAARLAVLGEVLAQQRRQAQDMALMRSGAAAERVAWMVRALGGGIVSPQMRKALPPLKEMARIVDVTPETVCRELKRLLPARNTPNRPRKAAGTRKATLALV